MEDRGWVWLLGLHVKSMAANMNSSPLAGKILFARGVKLVNVAIRTATITIIGVTPIFLIKGLWISFVLICSPRPLIKMMPIDSAKDRNSNAQSPQIPS